MISGGRQCWLGLEGLMSLSPLHETYWSRIGVNCAKFWSFLQLKSVKCLQTASALGRHLPQTLYQGFTPKPHWGLVSPDSLGYSPQMKIPAAATAYMSVFKHAWSLAAYLFELYSWFKWGMVWSWWWFSTTDTDDNNRWCNKNIPNFRKALRIRVIKINEVKSKYSVSKYVWRSLKFFA